MKKQFKIHQVHPNFVAIDLIEDGKTIGGYIAWEHGKAKNDIIRNVKKEGYIRYEANGN